MIGAPWTGQDRVEFFVRARSSEGLAALAPEPVRASERPAHGCLLLSGGRSNFRELGVLSAADDKSSERISGVCLPVAELEEK